jgi:hypothetical protein
MQTLVERGCGLDVHTSRVASAAGRLRPNGQPISNPGKPESRHYFRLPTIRPEAPDPLQTDEWRIRFAHCTSK